MIRLFDGGIGKLDTRERPNLSMLKRFRPDLLARARTPRRPTRDLEPRDRVLLAWLLRHERATPSSATPPSASWLTGMRAALRAWTQAAPPPDEVRDARIWRDAIWQIRHRARFARRAWRRPANPVTAPWPSTTCTGAELGTTEP